jgi:tRNA(fMet)-specific endonuclease VapC
VTHLLDTNLVIQVLRGNQAVIGRLRSHRPSDVAISSIVAHELYYGAFRGAKAAENLVRVDALAFEVLDFDVEDARRSGEVRAALATAGQTIGPYDVLIAGQALSRSLVLVTRNMREFSRISELRLEDWQD